MSLSMRWLCAARAPGRAGSRVSHRSAQHEAHHVGQDVCEGNGPEQPFSPIVQSEYETESNGRQRAQWALVEVGDRPNEYRDTYRERNTETLQLAHQVTDQKRFLEQAIDDRQCQEPRQRD